MICPQCRKAGSFNANLKPNWPNIAKLIETMHKDCPGGTWCDCQHFVGPALNFALLIGEQAPAVEDAEADVLEPVELCTRCW